MKSLFAEAGLRYAEHLCKRAKNAIKFSLVFLVIVALLRSCLTYFVFSKEKEIFYKIDIVHSTIHCQSKQRWKVKIMHMKINFSKKKYKL